MSSPDRLRSLWFESRHLAAGAPELAAELAALDDAARAEILATGDRLAAISLTLAQEYCRRAAAAWRRGPQAFRAWVARGERLARDGGSRDAAGSYFTLGPDALADVPAGDLDLWATLACRVLRAGRRLGETFVAASAAVLSDLDDRRGERLSAWVDLGLRLATEGGWEAEALALHFFAGTGVALPLFAPEDFPIWAEIGRAAERLGGAGGEFFTSTPAALHLVPPATRAAILRLAAIPAATTPIVAVELYCSLPAALAAFPDTEASLLAAVAAVATHAPGALGELLPVLRALLDAVPPALRAPLTGLAAALAARFPAGTVAFFRVLPRLLERTGVAGVEHWIEEGLAVAADNPDAGIAYFALDSRTSRAVLAARSTAVAFGEVEGLLKHYLKMLSGRAYGVEGRAEAGYRPPFVMPDREAPDADATAAFPLRVDVFTTSEANLRLYRLIAAQHAGRVEFGSAAIEPSLAEFLARFEQPAVAEHLLAIFEGVRVDAALARTYRGLAADLRVLARLLARDRVRLPGTIEQLTRVLAHARRPDLVRLLPSLAERLAAPDATAAESARATVLVYAAIMQGQAGLGLTAGASGFPELFDDAALGDLLLDLEGDGTPAGGDTPLDGGDTPAPAPADPPDVALELEQDDAGTGAGAALDPAELLRLLQQSGQPTIKQGGATDVDALGLYITDLAGKLPRERIAELQALLRQAHAERIDVPPAAAAGEGAFFYDEWDYRIGDYRSAWCRLGEVALASDTGDFFHRTLAQHAQLLPEIRRQFQRIRPERYRIVHGLEDGEDFDLDAVITARADRRSGHPPSPKLYQARQREERDVATLFLLDMSASTDEPVPGAAAGRRVIDVTKEALVVMTEALEGIGDTYGIYGFSGHGRAQVEFYVVKHFNEPLTSTVKGRIGAIEPKRSTRMGPALRHAVAKLRAIPARSRHILLLSDGFPQDLDYGDDRRSNTYGIQDTMIAFQEALRAGVTPFCITVDKAGHDYLKEICEPSRYLVIEDITALPRELPKIYQRFVRP